MLKKLISLSALMLLSTLAHADWTLNNELSSVNFVSVKKDKVGESHSFKSISGSLSDKGALAIDIDLTSVQTGIGIRDQRMAEFLFETGKFAQLNLTADVAKQLHALVPNQPQLITASATLLLHGVEKNIEIEALATKSIEGDLLIASTKPVIINPVDYNLNTGIDKLQQLAGLSGITRSVPVSFVLSLDKK